MKDPFIKTKQEKEHSFGYRFSLMLLAIIAVFSLVMLYLLFYPFQIVKPNIQPYKVITKNVPIGAELIYQVDSCKYQDIAATVTRSFVCNGVQYPAIAAPNNIARGCRKTNVALTVPNYIPIGTCHLELDVNYKVNALTDKTYHFITEEFRIATPSGEVK